MEKKIKSEHSEFEHLKWNKDSIFERMKIADAVNSPADIST